MRASRGLRLVSIAALGLVAVMTGGAVGVVQDICGPFTDVSPVQCPFVLELYYLGITAGTSPTTFSPDNGLTRGQGAVLLAKGVDQVLLRGGRRAALNQWWTPQGADALKLTTVGSQPQLCQADGADIWVANYGDGTVSRVRGSDGTLVGTWTGAASAWGVLVAMGRVFVTGGTSPGKLYMIDPSQPPGTVIVVSDKLGDGSNSLTFDGSRIWTANAGGSVSIVTPGQTVPWSVSTVTSGFADPEGACFDGRNVWVTDRAEVFRLDSSGAIVQTVSLDVPLAHPRHPIFDGANIWVPSTPASSVTVIQASTGTILATFRDNGINQPTSVAFDGQRILVTNFGGSVSLWKAADLTPIGSITTDPFMFLSGSCSDGINFWISGGFPGQLARF